ncbi:hypothetical protein A2230_07005 [candidate division WOR-1 bacterium RIFOXYA2_FULL_36_21]|uniref:Clan AA aspartic protease n=1 Tax=candidate division WOR-1 bacterium RIFOXYB2_FULL_36_35 TaxID=1802578 RepID=A0A1F4S2Z9_UNCSA|nr:MAG: hypothetical protein A2230_07005 [candidate division WOR-1 bacterium RIFOXYA2_FULL_36_21]OGC14824.1 MAG: hypothetical protein A2290_00820 [candidate division WOR-1 bacterium RIFOXYB2_FULL_36_35]OGC15576.1 MAG: hypothetical protein A2282_09065 [candidate division WOR-1 bacterium RIFOXYA12_FULL_36_13]
MGLTFVTVNLRASKDAPNSYEDKFLVDTGATDSMVPGNKLTEAGIEPVGKTVYEMADGNIKEFPFGLAIIEFMGEKTAGRIVFGPDNCEPLLGVTALESVGILVDAANKTLKRMPAIPLK